MLTFKIQFKNCCIWITVLHLNITKYRKKSIKTLIIIFLYMQVFTLGYLYACKTTYDSIQCVEH